jgi:hypothetical protein
MLLFGRVRAVWSFCALFGVLAACGGAVSTLHAKGKPSGNGPPHLDILNHTDVSIERLHIAETEAVDRARAQGVAPGSDGDRELWGPNLVETAALGPGKSFTVTDARSGRYDVLVLDSDEREQLVKGLKLAPGGKYVLELVDDGWQLPR